MASMFHACTWSWYVHSTGLIPASFPAAFDHDCDYNSWVKWIHQMIIMQRGFTVLYRKSRVSETPQAYDMHPKLLLPWMENSDVQMAVSVRVVQASEKYFNQSPPEKSLQGSVQYLCFPSALYLPYYGRLANCFLPTAFGEKN
jgi:hypothetical protein